MAPTKATKATKTLNIYQRINEVMKEGIIYLKKGSAGQGTGVLYDDMIAKLAPYLVKHGIVVVTDRITTLEARQTAKGNYIYQAEYKVSYINIDDPTDRIENIVEAHAQDNGDKAPGKSLTYATKISMLKVFGIESGENEESREEMLDIEYITPAQGKKLFDLMCLPSGHYNEVGARISRAFNIGNFELIKASKFDSIYNAAYAAHQKMTHQIDNFE